MNYYEILGLDAEADAEEIEMAHGLKKKMLQRKMAAAEGNEVEQEKYATELRKLFQIKKTLCDSSAREQYNRENGLGKYAGYAAPKAAPQPAYQAPQPQYVAPQPAYQAPQPQYVAPQPAYQAPQPEYVAPQPAYQATKPKQAAPVGCDPLYNQPPVDIPAKPIWLCQNSDGPVYMYPKMANRHGLIAGATGTGKTVTLEVMATSFSDLGVPVFLADIKGDVSGVAIPGEDSEGFQKRIHKKLGLPEEEHWSFYGYPTRFWDVYGKFGHPVRTTISEMGPELIARLLELNDTQTGVLNIIFKYCDDNRLLLEDLKDLRTMVQYAAEHPEEFKSAYGSVASQTVGAIQRSLLRLSEQGGDIFFGEPSLRLEDWFTYDNNGKGMINLLNCTELFQHPLLYSTFLLWMLSSIYDMLPEAGDLAKPKMVFFFDEAHLIFKDAPRTLLDKVEQIVRLIRSKGVGVYFITQQPADIPDTVLSQLGNKVQHALRAYTPKDQAALKSAAKAFRPNPKLNTEQVLPELGTGEVLVSLMGEDGIPGMVQRAYVMPPHSAMNPCDEGLRQQMMARSPLASKYAEVIDNWSAYEIINQKLVDEQNKAVEEKLAKQRAAEEAARAKEEAARQRAEIAERRERERQEDRERRERERQEAKEEKARKEAEAKEEKARKEAEAKAERARKEAEAKAERARKEAEAKEERARKEAEAKEERERRAAERKQQQMLNMGIKVLGGSSGVGKIARGILGSFFK